MFYIYTYLKMSNSQCEFMILLLLAIKQYLSAGKLILTKLSVDSRT